MKTINIAPYVVSLREEQRITYVTVRDERGMVVLRAHYNKAFNRYDDIKITVKRTAHIHDLITIMDKFVEEF